MTDANDSIDRAMPWSLIILAVLPGLAVALGDAFGGSLPWARAVVIGAWVAPGVMGLIIAIARRSLHALPAWSLLSIGFMALFLLLLNRIPIGESSTLAIGLLLLLIALGVVVWRARPGKPPAIALWLAAVAAIAALLHLTLLSGHNDWGYVTNWSFLFPVAAAGLLPAPAHGLRAALLLVPAGMFMMSFHIEHPIYFWQTPGWSQAWGWSQALSVAMALLFMVLLPAWVLRARSPVGRAIGLLVPPALYYLLLITALATHSFATDWYHILSIARPVVELFSILAVFGAVCAWLGRDDEREAQGSLNDGADGSRGSGREWRMANDE